MNSFLSCCFGEIFLVLTADFKNFIRYWTLPSPSLQLLTLPTLMLVPPLLVPKSPLKLELLLLNNQELNKKVETQDRWIKRQRKKIPVIDWLNTNCKPDCTYTEWEKNIVLNQKDLQLIFDNDFVNGMYYIMQKTTESLILTIKLKIPWSST